jgi:hypothetical protein
MHIGAANECRHAEGWPARAAGVGSVEYGLVPANSFLLVESLDRLSRDQILEAQALFLVNYA